MEYAVIGEKLSHSFSKEIHSLFADYDYKIVEIEENELENFFKKRDFRGINVTIPYKNKVIPYLDEISSEAQKLSSVNTIVNKNGKLYGYNTDYLGLEHLLEKNNIDLKNKKVLILGSGGTARTAKLLCDNNNAESFIVSRQKRENTITYDEAINNHSDAEIIINATPVGMFPNNNQVSIDINYFTKLNAVVDAIYNPLNSKLVLEAKSKGIKAVGGLYMLVSQAKCASEYFQGKKIKAEITDDVYKKIYKSKENIVLIGMPTSGKSTVGQALAKELGRNFVDTDTLIERKIGKTIFDYINEKGEAEFRKIESDIINDISKYTSLVIATGGGSILNEKNTKLLKQNGKLYFLDRSLNNLFASSNRPLSGSKEKLEKLYNERIDIYNKSNDEIIDGNQSIDRIVKLIKEKYL